MHKSAFSVFIVCCCALMLSAQLFALPALGESEPVDVLAPGLPILVNKDYPLDEDFIPADLVYLTDILDPSLVRMKNNNTKIRAVRAAVEALETMLEAAEADGIRNWQISTAYRSIQDQEALLNNKIRSYQKNNPKWSRSRAKSAALRTVAEPRCSEHHLGLAFDVNVPGTTFKGTKQCKWLHAHCWEYGFIVRYQEDKTKITGFAAEAWHIRYVGVKHSLYMRDNNFCLEEYLEAVQAEPEPGLIVEDMDEEEIDFETLFAGKKPAA